MPSPTTTPCGTSAEPLPAFTRPAYVPLGGCEREHDHDRPSVQGNHEQNITASGTTGVSPGPPALVPQSLSETKASSEGQAATSMQTFCATSYRQHWCVVPQGVRGLRASIDGTLERAVRRGLGSAFILVAPFFLFLLACFLMESMLFILCAVRPRSARWTLGLIDAPTRGNVCSLPNWVFAVWVLGGDGLPLTDCLLEGAVSDVALFEIDRP